MIVNPTADYGADWCEVTIPGMRLVNAMNRREHWGAAARRAKEQRLITALVLRSLAPCDMTSARHVTITKCGGAACDKDGLASSIKHIQDGISDWAGLDDGDPAWCWEYRQERGSYGVRIRVGREAE